MKNAKITNHTVIIMSTLQLAPLFNLLSSLCVSCCNKCKGLEKWWVRSGVCLLTLCTLYPLSLFLPTMFPAPPAAPERPSVTFPVPRQEFTITWNEPPPNMGEAVDTYYVTISGPGDLCGNNSVRVTEPNYTCSILTMPQEGDTYTFTVQAANCDGRQRGQQSLPLYLQGIYVGLDWMCCEPIANFTGL